MTRPVVHLGPTLSHAEAAAICEADFRPPAQRGDVIRAVLDGARVFGLIDGFKHQVLAVTHKEILFALDRGVQVLGAASLGALRAAELAPYGMVGIGKIFQAYRAGESTSDEVAVSHGPPELGYPVASEAMVNVRATVAAAAAAGLLATSAERFIAVAKVVHFPERTWSRLLESALKNGLPPDEIAAFVAWLPSGRVDQKRLDAIALLEHLAGRRDAARDDASRGLQFRPTEAFASLLQRVRDEGAD